MIGPGLPETEEIPSVTWERGAITWAPASSAITMPTSAPFSLTTGAPTLTLLESALGVACAVGPPAGGWVGTTVPPTTVCWGGVTVGGWVGVGSTSWFKASAERLTGTNVLGSSLLLSESRPIGSAPPLPRSSTVWLGPTGGSEGCGTCSTGRSWLGAPLSGVRGSATSFCVKRLTLVVICAGSLLNLIVPIWLAAEPV